MTHLCQDFSPIVAPKDHSAFADEAEIPSMRLSYLRWVLNISSSWMYSAASDADL